MTKIGDCIEWGAQQLEEAQVVLGHGTDNYWDEAVYAALAVFDLPLDASAESQEITPDPETQERYQRLIRQRITTRQPLPYLFGFAWYQGLRFQVTPDVLVPRSPLAEVIHNECAPWLRMPPQYILEIGTGCGALAILCAQAWPLSQVRATDIMPAALEVARENAALHQVTERLTFEEADIFPAKSQTFDLILSNPPYVSEAEWQELPLEFQAEPKHALYAPEQGLAIVKRILERAPQYLSETGLLVVEVGDTQQILEDAFPMIPWVWQVLENGGSGVFMMSRHDLVKYHKHFALS